METADRRLTLVSSSLEAGGAERVASTLANRWSDRGISVHIITYSKESAEPFYELDPRIALTQLNIAHPSLNVVSAAISNVKRIIRLRRTILSSQPDVVISFLTETNVLTLMAMFGTRIPVIVTEHTDPEICRMSSVWSKLRGFTYRFANNVVVLNRHIQDYFWDRMRIRTTIIPNPIVQSEARRNVRQQHTKQIVSVGRFAAEKRFELLVRAFYRVSKRCPDWNLIIIGDGPQRPDIRELAEELGISDRVLLPGPTKDPEAVLRQSKIFVSTSVQEGFPMALCEAMANGLAVVSAEYNASVRNIIEDGVNGLLVPVDDEEAVAVAINRLIDTPEERERLGTAARNITDEYGVNRVMAIWESVFEKTSAKVAPQVTND